MNRNGGFLIVAVKMQVLTVIVNMLLHKNKIRVEHMFFL